MNQWIRPSSTEQNKKRSGSERLSLSLLLLRICAYALCACRLLRRMDGRWLAAEA